MKKLSLLLVLIIILGAFSACTGIGDDLPNSGTNAETPDFELSYEISTRQCMRGDIVTVTASVKNISGKDLTYSAVINSYYPTIELYCNAGGKVNAKLEHREVETYSGFDEFTAKAGQIGSYTYTFNIPTDAALGAYDITLNYRGEVCTFTDALIVVGDQIISEETRQEHPESVIAPVTITAGKTEITPLRYMLSISENYADGSGREADGLGISKLFDDPNADLSVIPEITVDGKTKITPNIPVNASIEIVDIYNKRVEKLAVSLTNIEALSDTEWGEYYIVFTEKHDSRGAFSDVSKYTVARYQSVFKLIVGIPDRVRFSYAEVIAVYKEGVPGVVTSGFKNTDKSELEIINTVEASERAGAEVTVEYNYVDVKYDPTAEVWQILFAKKNVAGGGQTVYLDNNGVTLLIVYGE